MPLPPDLFLVIKADHILIYRLENFSNEMVL